MQVAPALAPPMTIGANRTIAIAIAITSVSAHPAVSGVARLHYSGCPEFA
jgi:hypothetical protein